MTDFPQKITLKNTNKRLDYYDKIENLKGQNSVMESVWEMNGRYFVLNEVCKGMYQSGKKKGQLCWKSATSWRAPGYCAKHTHQEIYEPAEEDLSSSEN